jgi:hypothetical protein
VVLGIGTTVLGGFLGRGGGSASEGAGKGLTSGEAGSYADLKARSVVGDGLEAHHMPQAALEFTSRGEGGALILEKAEHMQTRTYGWRGLASRDADAGLSFRTVLARDIRDVRAIVGPKYDGGLRGLIQYYRENFPDLMEE